MQSISSDVVVRAQDSMMIEMLLRIEGTKAMRLALEEEEFIEQLESHKTKNHSGNTETIVRKFKLFSDSAQGYGRDSLSTIIALSAPYDGIPPKADSSFYKGVFEELEIKLKSKGLPNKFKIVTNDSFFEEGLSTLLMKDLNSRKQYAAVFNPSFWTLLSGMVPQIVFSVLLLAITLWMFLLLKARISEKNRLLELKDSFVSNITHELKTPIATIGVAIDAAMERGLDHPLSKEYMDISKRELERLNLLVERVLKISQFENHQVELREEKVDFYALSKEVAHITRPLLERKQIQLQLSAQPDLPAEVLGDRIHLTNVIFNLVDNGIKYGPTGCQLNLHFLVEKGFVVLKYSDDGPGIPETYRDKIFERFFRIPTGDDHSIKGHGLGLSYVKQVILHHGGTIVLGPDKEPGTQFTIKIPQFGQE